ncbi:aromatic ring-hydroxylating dioxygenase subunit alpha [Hyphococcus luteus]|uniref:Rieske (2Fe-2S) protein n=1 Tax=Hyphococcus luteus TaxID=2058213 RepID=A0A2S7K4H5_9PROT|nr:aromatic ring-hydroxylating dioxygenase subunit alpha [Marinicaulis flavus]PQA87407.1 Rieske (2Fe-2S) protein [Marinicaulis flavus]
MIGAKSGFNDNGINWPDDSEGGYRVPYSVFMDENIYREEQKNIFRGPSWSFVALEAEIPNRGDFKSTFIGDVPVIVIRNGEGGVNVLVNRCAHRGAAVCRKLRGNTSYLECVYHSWAYDLDGNLTSVPFRRGMRGKGGMPSDFSMAEHGLKKIRVQIVNGLIFATFRSDTPDLEKYLGARMVGAIKRIFNREIEVLGDERQRIHGNWKLYAENVRDPYHASLLHLFHATFGLYRSTQVGSCVMDELGRHSLLVASQGTSSEDDDEDAYSDQRSFNSKFVLQDPSLLKGKRDFDDDISLVILSIFPNLVVQQISNTLAVRQIVTYSPNEFELVWTMFGYEDDDDEMRRIRIKQNNLIGPGGLISMEDGEAVELVNRAITHGSGDSSFIAMGGGKAESADHLITEGAIIGFWQHYRELMRI